MIERVISAMTPEVENDELRQELRTLRAASETANVRTKFYADQVSALADENAELHSRLDTAHNQMRIMRQSAVWRAGSVFRRMKRFASMMVQNVIRWSR